MPDNNEQQSSPRGPAPALGLGERLRSARKARALSVEQVADALRLEEASVVALEEGRFDAMGAPVFVRGHLKRYAQLVGLPAETVLEAYRTAAPHSDAPPTLTRPRAQADAVRLGAWTWWLAGAVILIVIIIAMGSGDEQPVAPAPPVPLTPAASAPPVAAPPTAPDGSGPTAEQQAVPPAPAPNATPSASPEATGTPPPATAPVAPPAPAASPPGD